MNGKSSPGLVMDYTFLADNDATINFKSKELPLGGINVHCLSNAMEDPMSAKNMESQNNGVMELG